MAASFRVYIDESGDEGFAFGAGSSEWFVLSAVVTHASDDLAAVKLVDSVRMRLNRPPWKPLHFRDLRHEHRLVHVDEIARQPLRVVSVLVHKPSLDEPEEFGERYRLYFHAARYLLERVSWYCRDHRHPEHDGDGTADIAFSNRSGMSYQELRSYLDTLRERTDILGVRIDWSVVRTDRIHSFTPGRRMGLQVADAVAGSFFYATQASQYGFTEDRYARMLKPVVYHHRGSYLGYGIKLWPHKAEARLEREERLTWIGETYQTKTAGPGS
jgi:hypothetical protein